MINIASKVLVVAALCLLVACDGRRSADVLPHALDREAVGYYCNMIVVDHSGPKGQIFLRGKEQPLWFTSVRDTIAFILLPEEPKDLAVVYVNDMGRASWDAPEPDTWIDARLAWYVIGSNKVGGMGAPEAVPFEIKDRALDFAREHGGRVLAFADIPADEILAPVDETQAMSAGAHGATAQSMAHGSQHGMHSND